MKKDRPKFKQIIDAAVRVIADKGYHAARVSKIAEKAKVADGTIYLYFRNKEDILITLFQEKMGNFVEKTRRKIAGYDSAAEKLLILIDSHFQMLAKDPQLAVVTQLELRQTNKALRLKINSVLKNYLQLIDDILREGVDNGDIVENLNIRLGRQMIFGTIDETATSWVMNDFKYDLPELAKSVHQLLLRGCAKH